MEARHFNQRISYVTNMQLLSIKIIKEYIQRINTLFRLKLYMKFTVKFYDVLLLCSGSLPMCYHQENLGLQYRCAWYFLDILLRSLDEFHATEMPLTVAVVTGTTAKIIANFDSLGKAAMSS